MPALHSVKGNEIARIGIFGSKGVGFATVVGFFLCVSKLAGKASWNFAGAHFNWNVEASFASPGLDVLKATVTEAMV
jgi:hypothetical protein